MLCGHQTHMNRTIRVITTLSLCLFIPCSHENSWAEGGCANSFSLEELRAFALSRSATVAMVDRRYADEVASALERETMNNPELQLERTFTGMKLGGADDPQTQISLGIPLRVSDFGSRARVADLIRKAAETQKERELFQLLLALRVSYLTIWSLQEERKTLEDGIVQLRRHLSFVQQGVLKGLLSKGEEEIFLGEIAKMEAEKMSLTEEIVVQQEALLREVGTPCAVNVRDALPSTVLPSEEELLQRAVKSPLGLSQRVLMMRQLAEAQQDVAQDDALPALSPRIVYQHTNDGGDFLGVGVTVPLPLFSRNQGGRERSSGELKEAQREESLLEGDGLKVKISLLRRATFAAEQQAEIYSTKVVPSLQRAYQSQQELFKSGKGNVVQVWQVVRELISTKKESLRKQVKAEMSRVRLSVLIGEEL